MMKRLTRVLLVLVLLVFVVGCATADQLTLGYAARRAESDAMKGPYLQGKITNVATQKIINTAEGDFDSAWNCAYAAYMDAVANTPSGQAVKVTSANFKPCIDKAWGAIFNIISTIRVFDPGFLASAASFTLVDGTKIAYDPKQFTSPTPSPKLKQVPAAGFKPF